MGKIDQNRATSREQTSGVTSTNQTQQNQFAFMKPPDNPYYQAAEGILSGFDGGAAQAREAHARNINTINESGNSIFGYNTPDYARDQIKQSGLFRNNLQLGRNLMDAKTNEMEQKFGGSMQLGAATDPDLVQTGSTMSGTTTSNTTSSGEGTFRDSPLNSIGKGFKILGM
jgi:hypothetical protein